MARWEIRLSFRPNSIVASENNLTWISDDLDPIEHGEFILQGDYQGVIALAAFERRHWISVNGYNPISVERTFDKGRNAWTNGMLRSVRYIIRAHFGMPAYTLCTITRLD